MQSWLGAVTIVVQAWPQKENMMNLQACRMPLFMKIHCRSVLRRGTLHTPSVSLFLVNH